MVYAEEDELDIALVDATEIGEFVVEDEFEMDVVPPAPATVDPAASLECDDRNFGDVNSEGEDGKPTEEVVDVERGLPVGPNRGNSWASCSRCFRDIVFRADSRELIP